MRHWVSMLNDDPARLAKLVALAQRFKQGHAGADADRLRHKILTLVFFNPSLRTRTSFEAGMLRHGGGSICLSVGGDTWQLEERDGVVMDGACSEHIKEAAPVLSRYGDLLAVRSFGRLKDAAEDAADRVIRMFEQHATVPVINMESAMEHPCQGLADWQTMAEKLGTTAGKRFVLTWAPHIKGLPLAVPHSAVLSAAAAGMEVTIAHPPGYDLHPAIVQQAQQWCTAAGTKLHVTHEQLDACRASDVVYVKSWGATPFYGNADAQTASFAEHRAWMVTPAHLGRSAIMMHCLPVRRNLVLADAALDDPRSAVVDEAENRLWAQCAIMSDLLAQRAVN